MKKIMKKNEGFTLAELLIVVAIIAVLVAVSIPIFTGKLEKSREATDIANLRAAKAAAVSAYLSSDKVDGNQLGNKQSADVTLYYDADAGELVSTPPTTSYGKGTTTVGDSDNTALGYDPSKAAADYVTVKIAVDGTVTVSIQ